MHRLRTVLLFASFCVMAHPAYADSSFILKTYTVGPYQVDAGFIPDKQTIVVGEPLWVTLQLTNSGSVPFKTVAPTYADEFPAQVTVIDPTGQAASQPPKAELSSDFVDFTILQPGRKGLMERTLATAGASIQTPGTYTFICKSSFDLQPITSAGGPENAKHLDVIDSFSVVVLPSDRRAMGRVIDQLGAAALTGPDEQRIEAVESLNQIKDDRTIGWYGKIIAQQDGQTSSVAVRGLEQYATVDAALALLPDLGQDLTGPNSFDADTLKAMEDRAGAKRETLVEAVRLPLLKELVDPAASKRVHAVAALGDTGDSTVLQPLIAAMSDPDKSVRTTAALAIGKLGDTDGVPTLMTGLQSTDPDQMLACAKALIALKIPFDPAWVLPIAKTYSLQNQTDPIQALQMIVTNGGKAAGAAIASGIHLDDPSPANPYNFWFLYELDSCPGAPHLSSLWQQDSDPTCPPSLIENNRKILAQIQTWITQQATQ